MSPPAATAVTAVGGHTSAEAKKGQTEELIRDARAILTNCGVIMGQSRISRLVRQFEHRVERNGFAFFDFLANSVQLDADTRRRALANPDVQRVIAYADPTGETAVAHVMKERRQ